MAHILRLLYGSFFASVAIEYVFLPFYFTSYGLSAADIGILFTGRTVVVVLVQPHLSALADRLERPHLILKVAMLAQFLGALALGGAESFAGFATVAWIQAIFRAPIVPVIDSTTVRTVGPHQYGKVRLWGSLGFGVSAAIVGQLTGSMDYDQAGSLAIALYAVATAFAAMTSLSLPRESGRSPVGKVRPTGMFKTAFVIFIVWNAMHWTAISAYNAFFSLHTKELGLSTSVPGYAMAVAIGGEALAFLVAPRLFRRGGSARWVYASIALSVVRWMLTATATDAGWLVVVQVLHFFSFGIWYAAAIDHIGTIAGQSNRATYQGVFSAGVLAGGSIIGSLAGGWLLELAGGAILFRTAAVVELVALSTALISRRHWNPRPAFEG